MIRFALTRSSPIGILYPFVIILSSAKEQEPNANATPTQKLFREIRYIIGMNKEIKDAIAPIQSASETSVVIRDKKSVSWLVGEVIHNNFTNCMALCRRWSIATLVMVNLVETFSFGVGGSQAEFRLA